jgi:hypothetical protein
VNGIAGLYGGYSPTIEGQAELTARRFNPFLYLATGQGGPVEAYPVETANGYATGGVADAMPATTQLVTMLQQIGGQRRQQAPDLSLGVSSGDGQGANAGAPADAAGTHGSLSGIASAAAGMIPGGRGVTAVGNGFNGIATGLMGQNVASQLSGVAPSFGQQIGAAVSGLLGGLTNGALGTTPGVAGIEDAADPGVAGPARGIAKAAVDAAVAAAQAPSADMVSALGFANGAGYGIAGTAGPSASGVNAGVGVNQDSQSAFGQPGMTSMAQGNDGVNAASGATPAGFGGMASGDQATANSNGEGSQGGAGASGAGGASGGGSGGGDGANGGGGDNGGGWARGGMVGHAARFSRGSGLVHGTSDGRADKLIMSVPRGSYVVPADVVSGMGQGNTMAGAKKLRDIMPRPGKSRYADGGIVGRVPEIPIQISPGEFVVHPAHVEALGGPQALDQLVQNVRQSNMQVAQGMPGPR